MSGETSPTGGPAGGRRESLWLSTTPGTDYEPLAADLSVDVAVVGGGITGLTTAIELVERGREVAVLEADRIVASTTGHTTAKLTSLHGLQYADLHAEFGPERARQYADANEAAIDAVEERIDGLGVDADFERRPAYTYATDPADVEDVRQEVRVAQALDLPASFVESTELPFDVEAAVRFDDQAQFHPREYLLAIAEAIVDRGGRIFERTRVRDVDPGSPCRLETEYVATEDERTGAAADERTDPDEPDRATADDPGRHEVVADDVVVASHFPVYDRGGYFARLRPKRAYLLAVEVAGDPPEGMYLSTDSPPDTIRSHPIEGEDLLLVGGQNHTPGEGGPTEARYRRCEAFAREHFDVESIEFRWSTHDLWSVDGVPYVGRAGPGVEHVHVATGFGGWGMTGGTAAGLVLSDLLVEGESPWAEVFDPLRVTPAASAKRLLKGGVSVARHLVGDRAASVFAGDDLPGRGEGLVRTEGGRQVGVARDEDGELHVVSASCPHMGCVLGWNDAEATWDCPCHGSRFTPDGDVVSGPAVDGLPERRL